MLNRIFVALSLVLVIQLAAPMAHAQEQAAVSLAGDVKVIRTVDDNGTSRTVYEAPNLVVPGDRLVFSTAYKNNAADVVEDFVVTNPLPAPVALAEDGEFDVSVDGGKSYGRLSALSVTLEDGANRPAELTDVTHVRWTLARLEPGASGSVTYFAVIR